jgi:hypothetical protein
MPTIERFMPRWRINNPAATGVRIERIYDRKDRLM